MAGLVPAIPSQLPWDPRDKPGDDGLVCYGSLGFRGVEPNPTGRASDRAFLLNAAGEMIPGGRRR